MGTSKVSILFLAVVLILSGAVFAKTAPASKKGAVVKTEVAYLAGGCFWGMEDLLRKLPGVTKTEVGYMGGKIPNATYNLVKTGTTEHAETVKVEFNP
ncbi:MAG: peptide-methionine (S)-S-oxide reductase, partial [Bdellovibrio sp.]|nr:peptide-methionine (S)-S-oxide reductase [Bdellovibrio sp.]